MSDQDPKPLKCYHEEENGITQRVVAWKCGYCDSLFRLQGDAKAHALDCGQRRVYVAGIGGITKKAYDSMKTEFPGASL